MGIEDYVMTEGEMERSASQAMPRINSHHQKLTRGRETVYPKSQEAQPQISDLQEVCCFKPHSLWYFVTAAIRNKYIEMRLEQ